MEYKHLLGRYFKHGSNDCYGLIRAFYKDVFDIELTNYARPDDWWQRGMNLYIDNVEQEGFQQVDRGLEPGDIIMMAIRSTVANHGAIYVGNNRIIHHFYNCLSIEEMYKGMWKNRTMAVYRHPQVKVDIQKDQLDLMSILPERVRQRLQAVISSELVSE